MSLKYLIVFYLRIILIWILVVAGRQFQLNWKWFVITEPKLYVVVHRLKRLLLALFNRKLLSQWKIDWKITFLSSHSLLCEDEMLKVAHGLLGKENDHLLVYWCCVIVVKKEIFVLLIKSNANECHTHAPSQLKSASPKR